MLTHIYSPRRARQETGFTLMELLIVVVIIGILAAIGLPIFLNQQKAAVDASVQSDVNNTSVNVVTWLVAHPNTSLGNTAAYTGAGGQLVKSGSNTIDVTTDASGAYTICGYNPNGSRYNANSAAYMFNGTTGQFSTYTGGCPGDGSGNYAAAAITTTNLPNAIVGTAYDYQLTATGSPAPNFTATGLPAGLSMDTTGHITGTPTTANSAGQQVVVNAANPSTTSKSYTMVTNQWVNCASENGTCAFTGTTKVRYGITGSYAYLTLTNGTPCSNAVFGDPAYGYLKACAYLQ